MLAQDRDWTVRTQLGLAVHAYLKSIDGAAEEDPQRARAIAEEVHATLAQDVRNRVRRAAAGHPR
jgi:hypothetical protein